MSNSTATTGTVSTEDRGPMINVVVWVITFTSTAFLGLRLYCKLSRNNNLWWDDHLLIASWVNPPFVIHETIGKPTANAAHKGMSRCQQYGHECKCRPWLWQSDQHHRPSRFAGSRCSQAHQRILVYHRRDLVQDVVWRHTTTARWRQNQDVCHILASDQQYVLWGECRVWLASMCKFS